MEIKRKVDVDKEFYLPEMYHRFMQEQNPSICVTGKFDVSKLVKHKNTYSFNAMLCYCIQQAAQKIDALHYAIKPDGLYYYTNVKTNAVIFGKDNQHYYIDYPYYAVFKDYLKNYENSNNLHYEKCEHLEIDCGAVMSTSAVINFPFESFGLGISDTFWDHFILWGKFVKTRLKTHLNITLRFHHALIDGQTAGLFFNELQKEIYNFDPKK